MNTEANSSTTEREVSMDQTDHQEQEGYGEEQELERRSNKLVLPNDGYEWKKYGQKFIKNIGKVRSYFKCQKDNCMAKKRAEWCESEPDNIRIVYEGGHNHGSVEAETGSSQATSNNTNQYNLLTQVLGDQSTFTRGRPAAGS